MAETTFTPNGEGATATGGDPKAHFTRAVEEAKAGAQALGKQAQDVAGTYRDKVAQRANDLSDEARSKGDDAKDRAFLLASDGKAKASSAIAGLGKLVDENAAIVDEKVGVKYGDYARTAAKSLQETADRLDQKELAELVEDARKFVQKQPALAVGIAAAGGFLLSRLFVGRD